MAEYKTLRNCVEQLKEAKVDKSNRRKIISKISSPSDLEMEISRLQFKEAGNDILMASVGGLCTLGGIYLINNLSNDFAKYTFRFITVLPVVALITGAVLAVENICGAVKHCYNSYTNKPYLIK